MIKFLHSKETIKTLVTPQDFSTQSSLVRKTSIPVGVASIKFFLLSLLLIWSTSSLWSQVTVSYAYTGSNQIFSPFIAIDLVNLKSLEPGNRILRIHRFKSNFYSTGRSNVNKRKNMGSWWRWLWWTEFRRVWRIG